MPYKPGQSGNPKGRPPGIQDRRSRLRDALADQGDELLATAVEMAKGGDTTMLSFLINRILPASKPETAPTEIALPAGSLTEQATALVNAAASGAMSVSVASELLAGLGVVGRLTELDEIAKRLETLEARSGGGQ
jgi:hypothetical protein